ncbi:MAG: hypothetical protein CL693_13615 [Cellvibrionaceae bacterium]|nr:hypothetical protein [Cellvibrionaceae bacterium]
MVIEQIERRERSFDEHYRRLRGEQIAIIYSLAKMGYGLHFVRTLDDRTPYAVLRSSNGLVGVDCEGELSFDPKITLRS